jgi:hypothetical protein
VVGIIVVTKEIRKLGELADYVIETPETSDALSPFFDYDSVPLQLSCRITLQF